MFKVPKKTSVWRKPIANEKYTVSFAPELIDFIVKKKKYQTFRFGNKYDYLNTGDKVTILETSNTNPVAQAIITNKEKTTFKDLPLNSPGTKLQRTKSTSARF